ncbi:MAG: site-specific integrase [Bacteroidales bacterium]|nr:site-specific integrase [Bacteroidales bacterium]
MIIKHSISVYIREDKRSGICRRRVLFSITYAGNQCLFQPGLAVGEDVSWDKAHSVFVNCPEGNELYSLWSSTINEAFKRFEVENHVPTTNEFKEIVTALIKGHSNTRKKKESFSDIFDRFYGVSSESASWSMSTSTKFRTLKKDLLVFAPRVSVETMDEAFLTRFVAFLRNDKVRRKPRTSKPVKGPDLRGKEETHGVSNETVAKEIKMLKQFLRWAEKNEYPVNPAYKSFRPVFKTTKNEVVYLKKEELQRIKELDIPKNLSHLETTRDALLFCCFSSLRYSDLQNLRRSDVKDGHMEVTIVKTTDSIRIDLNDVTRGIIEKYRDYPTEGDRVMPVCTNQVMNRFLKELCRMAGINERIRRTEYRGNQRVDTTKEKWELVGTHTGRRTFIVQALSMGIPPNVVMKWTGHSDYAAMKPYIDIVDSIKAREMTKFDSLL